MQCISCLTYPLAVLLISVTLHFQHYLPDWCLLTSSTCSVLVGNARNFTECHGAQLSIGSRPRANWLADLLACLTWGRICKVCVWACVWRGFEWIPLAEMRLFVKLNAWNPGQSRKLVERHRAMRSKASLTARFIKWLKMNSACFSFVFTHYPLADTKQ